MVRHKVDVAIGLSQAEILQRHISLQISQNEAAEIWKDLRAQVYMSVSLQPSTSLMNYNTGLITLVSFQATYRHRAGSLNNETYRENVAWQH